MSLLMQLKVCWLFLYHFLCEVEEFFNISKENLGSNVFFKWKWNQRRIKNHKKNTVPGLINKSHHPHHGFYHDHDCDHHHDFESFYFVFVFLLFVNDVRYRLKNSLYYSLCGRKIVSVFLFNLMFFFIIIFPSVELVGWVCACLFHT